MNNEQFNNLIDGKHAEWADLKDIHSLQDIMLKNLKNKDPNINNAPFKLNLIKGEDKKRVKNEINEHQKPIPQHISDEIHLYVRAERDKKTSERTIRRAVRRKWNIFVI